MRSAGCVGCVVLVRCVLPTNVDSLKDGAGVCQVVGLAKASDGLSDSVSTGGRKCRWGHAARCYLKGRCSRCRLFDPSLDRYPSSSAVERASTRGSSFDSVWNRQQKRGYNRVLTCMQYWQSNGYQVLWLMLSSAVDSDASKLAEHHQSLLKRVDRSGFPGVQHFQVRTSEGNGVLHVLWAWRAADGMLQKSFYIGQRWLSDTWRDLHGAPVVWICRVGSRHRDTLKVARYCIAQYVGEQAGYEYMSYSWRRTFGFPLVSCWRKFKELTRSYNRLIKEWASFLAGDLVWCEYGGFTMGSIRLGYNTYGADFWDMLHWN